MDVSFGTRLRLQREQQGVDLTAIADDTKIKRSLLDELERDNVSHWPEGIYRRAYIRSYARAIGLDPEAVVREFIELYPDPTEVVPVPAPPEQSRFRRLLSSAIGAKPYVQAGAPERQPEPPPQAIDVESLHFAGHLIAATADDAAVAHVYERMVLAEPEAVHEPMYAETVCPGRTLATAAELCTRLGRVTEACEVTPILEDAAKVLDASGLTLWSWDPLATALRASLAHGYAVGALPPVPTDAANAIAAAFRSGETCVVDGHDGERGAMVVPMMGPAGCVGVLAIELHNGDEQRQTVRALATIFAAQFATLLTPAPFAQAATA